MLDFEGLPLAIRLHSRLQRFVEIEVKPIHQNPEPLLLRQGNAPQPSPRTLLRDRGSVIGPKIELPRHHSGRGDSTEAASE